MQNDFLIRLSRSLIFVFALVLIVGALGWNVGAQQTADTPQVKATAVKVLEIGRAANKTITQTLGRFAKTYDPAMPLYIINYGTNKEIARREKLITELPFRWPHDRARITLVRGGPGEGPNTVIWKVPYGADNPEP